MGIFWMVVSIMIIEWIKRFFKQESPVEMRRRVYNSMRKANQRNIACNKFYEGTEDHAATKTRK
jgi:hypothetical protein